jgi:uncharacterized protein (DUF885 family)
MAVIYTRAAMRLLLLLVVLSGVALAQGPAHLTFSELTDQFIKESLAMSPVNASQAGYHQHTDARTGEVVQLDAVLDDLSAAAFAGQQQFYRSWRERLRHEAPLHTLGPQDAADWQLLDDQIALNLLELEEIQSYKHQPTIYVELIGNALFLPLTQQYAPPEVRMRHILARIEQVPRALEQARKVLLDSDPVFIDAALEENEGNIDLIENVIHKQVPEDSRLMPEYQRVAPPAVAALRSFSAWLQQELRKRATPATTWRLGKSLYDQKFRYTMQVSVTPEQMLADAERDMRQVRAEMLQVALPLHKRLFPAHPDHSDLPGHERENRVIGEVLDSVSREHAERSQLLATVSKDAADIQQFIREKHIVTLSSRDNLKIIPTPLFMRSTYSVAGFHPAPPLEPTAEAQYWVTPIEPSVPEAQAESRLREYNRWALQWLTIHEALPGHYIQAEHANGVQPATRRVLRALLGNGPYVEGWAEYIAQVMMDEGFGGNDPRFRLVMRKIRLRLLSNTILDVRMQTMNMTDEQAMELMTRDAFQTEAEARGKLRRAKLTSAQLPTYYVGLREWQRVRAAYAQRMGKRFDQREFHDRALDEGALPLPLLANVLGS